MMKQRIFSLIFLLPLFWASGVGAGEVPIPGVGHLPPGALESAPAAPVKDSKGNPRLDTQVNGLVEKARTSPDQATELAQDQSFSVSENRVLVQIITTPEQLTAALESIREMGGEVTGIGHNNDVIQAFVPVEIIESLVGRPGVLFIRKPAEAVPMGGAVPMSTTEGLNPMNVAYWHSANIKGYGVKVAIIDAGFQGYVNLLGTDLPSSVTVKNFVDGQTDADVNTSGGAHGLACAEIVHNIAPGATLFLIKIGTNVDLSEAVLWAYLQGVDVISTSLGWYNLTPGDGTGEFADLVSDADTAGIFWTTAASNDREAHWGGLYSDSGGYHQWTAGKIYNAFGQGDEVNFYSIPSGYLFRVFLRWNNWTNVNQDYDLYIYRWNGAGWDLCDSSIDTQDGSPGQRPTEYAFCLTSGADTYYAIGVKAFSVSGGPENLELFVPKWFRPTYILHSRSLSNLADAPKALTAAALDVNNPYPQESYSSEGPTNGPGGAEAGGAVKPDISGYANVSTEAYGPSAFNGTSSATPHVAGAAALVLNAYKSYTPAQVRSFLETNAIDMGAGGKDAVFGSGRLNLPSVVPDLVAVNDTASATVSADASPGVNLSNDAVVINVLSNDALNPVGGGTLSITSVSGAGHGSVASNGASIMYTPVAGFIGTDTFSYTLSDGLGHSDTATVTVNVSSGSASATTVSAGGGGGGGGGGCFISAGQD